MLVVLVCEIAIWCLMPDKDILVSILKVDSGEVRVRCDTLMENGSGDYSLYMWREGNYSCDCNRALFFARSGMGNAEDGACGDERYRVNVSDAATGELLYQEFVPESPDGN